MKQRLLRLALSTALVGSLVSATAGAALASSGSPGDETIVITINDSHAGGTYDQSSSWSSTTPRPTEHPSTSTSPKAPLEDETVHDNDPSFDPNPDDDFTPCADNTLAEYTITQEQIRPSATS